MLKKIFNPFHVDLGESEGDYRLFYLKDDITQSILYIGIVVAGVLSMIRMDASFSGGQPEPFAWFVVERAVFVFVSALAAVVLWKTEQPEVYDRLILGWLTFLILSLLAFNFTRPPGGSTAIFNVILTFAIYIFSLPGIRYSILLALVFSAGTIYIDYVNQAGAGPGALHTVIIAQLIAHALGCVAGLKIQSYRRKSFRAYMQEKDARELAAYLANIDPLTKSLTRRQFFNMADSEFSRSRRYRRPLSALVLDADRFKDINDTYGHHTGDLVLRNLSLVVLEQKRAQDTFGRLGGEEFALLLPETNLLQARTVAERIQKTWAETPSTVEGKLIRSTVSIGVTEVRPQDQSFEDILRRADAMMYRAKEAGRNQVAAE
jgi:diguanylate cyclase (GGDEF)-like protein